MKVQIWHASRIANVRRSFHVGTVYTWQRALDLASPYVALNWAIYRVRGATVLIVSWGETHANH